MKLATSCPACGKAITLFGVMAAPTPFHLSCKACKASLRIARLPKAAIVVAAVVVAAVGIGLGLLWHHGKVSLTLGVIITATLAMAIELLASLYVVTRAELEVKDPR